MNPFHTREGERLPGGSFRNHQSLLVKGAMTFTLSSDDQNIVAKEIPFFTDHVVIACITEGVLQGR